MNCQCRLATFILVLAAALPCAADTPSTPPTPPGPDSPGAALVTLNVKNATIASVAAEISKQTGNPITTQNFGYYNGVKPVTLNVVNKPFWSVLDDACQQAGLAPQLNQKSISLYPNSGYGRDCRIVDSGPIHLCLTQVTHSSYLTFPGQAPDYCVLNFNGMYEPRLDLLYYSTVGFPDKAVDDKGNSLVPPANSPMGDPRNYVYVRQNPNQLMQYPNPNPNYGNQQINFAVQIFVPPDAGHRIAKISGNFKFWMAEKYDSVTVANAPPANRNSVDYQTLDNGARVYAWQQGGNICVMVPHQSSQGWDYSIFQTIRVTFEDASGNVQYAYSGGGSGDNNTLTGYFYSSSGRIRNPKVEYPDKIEEIDIPYSFTNLPLP
ncbi:MAG TPA: hypothetical protein VL992_09085 [Tepidisphaeraceae bacterium]|nr:hypothetical protein [Tepidisphaeraceae bacterium]